MRLWATAPLAFAAALLFAGAANATTWHRTHWGSEEWLANPGGAPVVEAIRLGSGGPILIKRIEGSITVSPFAPLPAMAQVNIGSWCDGPGPDATVIEPGPGNPGEVDGGLWDANLKVIGSESHTQFIDYQYSPAASCGDGTLYLIYDNPSGLDAEVQITITWGE